MKNYFKNMLWTMFVITVSIIGGRIVTNMFYTIHEVGTISLNNGREELVYIDNNIIRIGPDAIYYHSHKNYYTNIDANSLVIYDKKEKTLFLVNESVKSTYGVKNE